jgi:hypothetical protein
MTDDLIVNVGHLERDVHALKGRVDQLERLVAVMRDQYDALESRLGVLVEVLVDAKQLDAQELNARVEAAAVVRRHAASEATAASQDVWDSAAPKR